MILYKCTKHYNYLQAYLRQTQTYLQARKLLKHTCTVTKVIKNAKLIKDWAELKLFVVLGLMK